MLVHIRTEETIAIPRKKLAIVHLRFREMIKGRNKEWHLVFSMKYLLFQVPFGRDERFPFGRDERFSEENSRSRRVWWQKENQEESDMWLVMAGEPPPQKWFAEAELLRVLASSNWWVHIELFRLISEGPLLRPTIITPSGLIWSSAAATRPI